MTERDPLESADTVVGPMGELTDPRGFQTPPPRLADRYELLGLLGTGGMGAVYRVRDTELGEVVALKMLHPDWARTPEALDRFRSEVRLARRVTHRHVARTFDIGEHEGERFLTMECVDGGSLAARIAERGALAEAEVIAIARAICAALSAAHAAGVVHRDLKPENVLFARDGRVVVTDFGISSAGGGEDAAAGTPAYMSPEQVAPVHAVDHRADLYALGVVMLEMLTGERAWQGGVRTLRPDVDPALAAVVRRCTAVSPADRFATADDVARALPGTDAATTVALPPRMPKPSRAGKTVAVLPFDAADDDRYLADGMTADLIDTLSMTRGLLVRPRGVVAKYRATTLTPHELGEQLSVDVIVEGSVRRTGDAVRVGARLIGTDDGFQLWARRFDAPLAELMTTTDAVAQAIAAALTTELPALATAAATDPAAIELYMRARQALFATWRDTAKPAADLFQQALALAPNDPRILSATAQALARMLFFGEGDRAAVAARCRDIAERAVTLAPELGDAWVALASLWLNSSDGVGAATALRGGLDHAPNSALVQEMVGRVLAEITPLDEAATRLEIALGLDPTMFGARLELARVRALQGDWDAADAVIVAIGAPLDQVAPLRGRLALWHGRQVDLGVTAPGTYAALCAELLASPTLTPAQRAWMADRAARNTGRLRALIHQRNAEVYGLAGEHDEALAAVRASVDGELIDLAWMRHCPLLAAIRPDPRFTPLLAVVEARAHRILDALRPAT